MGTADDDPGPAEGRSGATEDGHRLPADRDWPRGFGEASWWPFVAALGAGGLYVGAALVILGTTDAPLVPVAVGLAVAAGGAVLFVTGLGGWTYHAFVADYWERDADGESATTLTATMLLFLATELATFGGAFTYYFFARGSQVWSRDLLPTGGVLGPLVVANTAVLVLSSVTLHLADGHLSEGNRGSFVRYLAITLLLGLVFLAGQVYEYYEFLVAKGYGLAEGLYASAFYGLTGLHGLHVTLGVILLGIVLWRALRGQYAADRHASVTTATLYWHFVDAVWLFLVLVVYVGAVVRLPRPAG